MINIDPRKKKERRKKRSHAFTLNANLFVSLLVESATCEIIKKNKHLEGFIEIVNAPTREFAFGEPNL